MFIIVIVIVIIKQLVVVGINVIRVVSVDLYFVESTRNNIGGCAAVKLLADRYDTFLLPVVADGLTVKWLSKRVPLYVRDPSHPADVLGTLS